jgi:hypothetical protein
VRLRALLAVLAALALLAGCGGHHARQVNHHLLASTGKPAPTGWPIHGGRPHAPGFGQPPPGDFGLPAQQFTSPFTLFGYDAVTLANIYGYTSRPAVVGCYQVGPYHNCAEAHSRFPGAHLVSIDTYDTTVVARCLDVEPHDAIPSQAPGWVRAMESRGVHLPCIYADSYRMTMSGGVRYWLSRSGLVHGRDYLLWVAAWDNRPAVPPGYDGHQYASNSRVDHDSFLSTFFGPPPKPNAPGCDTPSESTSHCYGRFANRTFYNPRRHDWCSRGCNELAVVRDYDAKRGNPRKYGKDLLNDHYRLLFLDARLIYLIHHRSVKINGDNRVYGREHEVWQRAHGRVCGSWAPCNH